MKTTETRKTFNELQADIGFRKVPHLTVEDIDKITEHYRSGIEWNNYTSLRFECIQKYREELEKA